MAALIAKAAQWRENRWQIFGSTTAHRDQILQGLPVPVDQDNESMQIRRRDERALPKEGINFVAYVHGHPFKDAVAGQGR